MRVTRTVKPCVCNGAGTCYLCRLGASRPDYRAIWNAPLPQTGSANLTAALLPPCPHRGGETGEQVVCTSCPRTPRLKVYACALYGDCVPGKSVFGRAHCASCPQRPPGERPPNWAQDPQTCRAHRQEADRFLAELPPYPFTYHDRGVVIMGGGKYLACTHLTCKALRHTGWSGPIQVWHLGPLEMPLPYRALIEGQGVSCVDVLACMKNHPCRMVGGWESKAYAILHSPFREVLFLDADCYPVRNVTALFEAEAQKRHGATFWFDLPGSIPLGAQAFGLEPSGFLPLETGQIVVDKLACWAQLNLAHWYAMHSDWSFRHGYGDKTTFEAAWIKLGRAWATHHQQPLWQDVAFLHPGPDGQTTLVHRCRDKWRFDDATWQTPQRHTQNQFCPAIPLEAEMFRWRKELQESLRGVLLP